MKNKILFSFTLVIGILLAGCDGTTTTMVKESTIDKLSKVKSVASTSSNFAVTSIQVTFDGYRQGLGDGTLTNEETGYWFAYVSYPYGSSDNYTYKWYISSNDGWTYYANFNECKELPWSNHVALPVGGSEGYDDLERERRCFSHDFPYTFEPKEYVIKVVATSPTGETDSDTEIVTVYNQQPNKCLSDVDRDYDGVADCEDECPLTPGEGANGCRIDSDGDGVDNIEDQCDEEFGVQTNGCPDDAGSGGGPDQLE